MFLGAKETELYCRSCREGRPVRQTRKLLVQGTVDVTVCPICDRGSR
jgi:hypothetical protein